MYSVDFTLENVSVNDKFGSVTQKVNISSSQSLSYPMLYNLKINRTPLASENIIQCIKNLG